MKRRGRDLLPRYTRVKRRSDGQAAFFFEVPKLYREAGCTVESEALGTIYADAIKRVCEVLLPAFDSWRTRGASDLAAVRGLHGTFDWLIVEFKRDRRYREKDAKTRRQYDQGLQLAATYGLKDGRRFGELLLNQITPKTTDLLYEKLRYVADEAALATGKPRERRATANAAMRACRRAWNVVSRTDPKIVSSANPFAKMGLAGLRKGATPTATYDELVAFVRKADELGRSSLGTAAWVAWEWLPRAEDVFATFAVDHYRPRARPNSVQVIHRKTGEENWVPLIGQDGAPLYPELMARLDAVRRQRIGGLMILRDEVDQKLGHAIPWQSAKGDLTHMRHEVKRIIRAAALRDELSFRSFRHGGMTEGAESDLTDRELQAQSRHRSVDILPTYAKRTQKTVEIGALKRRAGRTKRENFSE